MSETWRPVVGHKGFYEVSDNGRVRSLDRHVDVIDLRCSKPKTIFHPGVILKPTYTRSGHLYVSLGVTRAKRLVHRIVLEAFIGPAPDGSEACHDNDIPDDNRLENLRWDTRSANMCDRTKNGVHHHSRRTHCKQGHEYTPDNIYVQPGKPTGRHCRMCRRIDSRRRKALARIGRVEK